MNRYKLHEPIPFPPNTVRRIHIGMAVRNVEYDAAIGVVTNEFIETKSGKYFFMVLHRNGKESLIAGEKLDYE